MVMKRIYLCFLFFVCGAFFTFAQTGINAIFNAPGVIVGNIPLGIDERVLDDLIRPYLEDTFNRHIIKRDLRVTELSYSPDWNVSTDELKKINVLGNFVNFAINNQILSGRFETAVMVRNPPGIGPLRRQPSIEPQENISITLFVNDLLSTDLRNALITNYINENYDNPLGIEIFNERLEVYPDRVYSYVSCVVNNNSFVYLRAVFETPPPQIEVSYIFTIIETPWRVNRTEVINYVRLPDSDTIIRSIQNEGGTNSIYEQIRGYYLRSNPRANPLKPRSRIKSITKAVPVDSNGGMIKLEIDLIYILDRSGFFGSYSEHEVKVFVFYQLNDERIWEYHSIENIRPEDIRTIRQ
jgi:hypothetical protein